MTLDKAIKRAEEVAEMSKASSEDAKSQGCSVYAMRCDERANEHRQLAEWLKELKMYKEQELCEDAISRESMLKYQQYLRGKMPNEENHKLWEFIKELPPVTPQNTERKTGEILTDYENYIDREGFERRVKKTTYCSLCKQDLGYNGDLLTHYCPNCGVKLEGEE